MSLFSSPFSFLVPPPPPPSTSGQIKIGIPKRENMNSDLIQLVLGPGRIVVYEGVGVLSLQTRNTQLMQGSVFGNYQETNGPNTLLSIHGSSHGSTTSSNIESSTITQSQSSSESAQDESSDDGHEAKKRKKHSKSMKIKNVMPVLGEYQNPKPSHCTSEKLNENGFQFEKNDINEQSQEIYLSPGNIEFDVTDILNNKQRIPPYRYFELPPLRTKFAPDWICPQCGNSNFPKRWNCNVCLYLRIQGISYIKNFATTLGKPMEYILKHEQLLVLAFLRKKNVSVNLSTDGPKPHPFVPSPPSSIVTNYLSIQSTIEEVPEVSPESEKKKEDISLDERGMQVQTDPRNSCNIPVSSALNQD